MDQDRWISIHPSCAQEMRREAFEALALGPDHLVIDLRGLPTGTVASVPLRDVRDAARDRHCGLTIELARLTVEMVQ
jgi:hypothetical protein